MSDFWFPRLSPAGRVVAGSKYVTVDTTTPVGPGTSPQWDGDMTVLYTRQPDGALVRWPDGAVLHTFGVNDFSVSEGRWAGWRAADACIVTSWGLSLPQARMPRLAPGMFAYVLPRGADWEIILNGQPIHRGELRDLRIAAPGLVVWSQWTRGQWETWGWRDGQVTRLQVAPGQELWPVPVHTPTGPWVLSHTDHALLLRPWGRTQGIVVARGVTDFPDVCALPEGLLVVWSDRGELRHLRVPYTAQLADLPTATQPSVPAPAPAPPSPPSPPPPMSYTPLAPDLRRVVEALHAERPGLIRDPHAFTQEAARRLHALDAKFGANGKRGSQEDRSEDCVAYRNATGPGGVEILDIISGANGSDPRPAWQDVTPETIAKGTVGRWLAPLPSPAVPPAPGPAPAPVSPPAPAPPPCQCPSLAQIEHLLLTAMAQVLARIEALEDLLQYAAVPAPPPEPLITREQLDALLASQTWPCQFRLFGQTVSGTVGPRRM